jgi:SAM-dependent methyltransferase
MSDPGDNWLYWYQGKEDVIEPQVLELLPLFRIQRVRSVLDLGCGTGRNSLLFAKSGFDVTAFDQSERAIIRAKQLAASEKLTIDFRRWNMTEFPYPYSDHSFDALVSTKVIHHTTFSNIWRIEQEITRILKYGGVLFIEVPILSKAYRLESEEGLKHDRLEQGTFVPLNGDEHGVPHHYFTEQELLSIFKDYEVVSLETLKEHFCLTAKLGKV